MAWARAGVRVRRSASCARPARARYSRGQWCVSRAFRTCTLSAWRRCVSRASRTCTLSAWPRVRRARTSHTYVTRVVRSVSRMPARAQECATTCVTCVSSARMRVSRSMLRMYVVRVCCTCGSHLRRRVSSSMCEFRTHLHPTSKSLWHVCVGVSYTLVSRVLRVCARVSRACANVSDPQTYV